MQLSRQLTGAFRPLCVKPQLKRLPADLFSLRARVAPASSPTQTAAIVWRGFASVYSVQTAPTLDQPTDSNAHLSVEVPDELGALFSQDIKSTSKVSQPSLASAHILDDSQHSIKASSLPAYAWPFLAKLHLAGHDVFVVGGTVRDLLLNQQPKDLDLVTTATLQQVKLIANRCYIVGHRYPIALVHASRNKIIEVSAFQPSKATPSDAADLAKQGRQGKLRPDQLDKPWAALWQQNMQQRDFTLNAMMYNPFSHLLFDYVGGMADCSKRRLQCCKDPNESFQEDAPRMLRAVRLAARCDLKMSHAVEAAIRKCAPRLTSISGSRLYAEAISIFSQGAAVKSFQLLWQLHMLDEIMPPYAAYARKHKISRTKPLPDDMTTWPLLLRLLYCMDKHASVDQPVAMQVVAAVLAAPFIVDTISAHRPELQNIISGKSAKLNRKTAQRLSPGIDSQPGSQAVAAAVVQGAVLCWEERRQHSAKVGTAMQQQHLLMTCIIDAALEATRTRLPIGLLPRANISAARRLLTAFHTSLSEQAQETVADQAKQYKASEGADVFVSKKGKLGKLSHSAKQNTVDDICRTAESNWQQLLL